MANEVNISKGGADTVMLQGTSAPVPWKKCLICVGKALTFKSPKDFVKHLRTFHCSKEGGSFICRYGPNRVCPSLPIEGVNDGDYEQHLIKAHVSSASENLGKFSMGGFGTSSENIPNSDNKPALVEDKDKWTIFMSKVNLPAVLNDPRLTRRETDFFTKTWGESFEKTSVAPSVHLTEVPKAYFRKYIQRTSGRLKAHCQLNASKNPDDRPVSLTKSNSQCFENSRSEIEAVPKMFLHQNFALENPETFNAVFPWTQIEVSRQEKIGKPKQSSKLLQEKLSHYLDIVEVQIAHQISLRSEAFFHAVSSHDKLQENMANTTSAIQLLREKIQKLNQSMVKGPLEILKSEQSRANHVKLYNKLKLMATVHQTQPTIQMLLSTNEFVGAVDLISTTQEVLAQELAGVHSFRHLGSQLTEMEKVIDKMMHEDFLRYVTSDLNRPLSLGSTIVDEEHLVAILFGMVRQHQFNFVDVYREEACTALKTVVKQTVIEAVVAAEDLNPESDSGSLADQMRLLNYSQWMHLLISIFTNLLIILKRVKAVVEVMTEVVQVAAGQSRLDSTSDTELLLEEIIQETGTTEEGADDGSKVCDDSIKVCDNMSNSQPVVSCVPGFSGISRISMSDVDVMISVDDYIKASNSLKEMLNQVCDHAHDRCVKVLVARARDGFLERLSSSEFVDLSRGVESFVIECEKLCGRKSTSLRGCLQSQANRFVNRFHEERKTKLSLILDNERWKQADVPVEFQELVNNIVETGKLSSIHDRKIDKAKKPGEFLVVENEKYAVVGMVLMLLQMICDYCQCVEDIPAATADILTRLIELLKLFNSRTCQLILGAGALQLVGLKTITTKNLALASRCLQLIVYYLPKIEDHFRLHLHGKQVNMLKHFTQITKDYNDHIEEISNKLVAIMDSMTDASLSKWEVKAPMPSTCFRNICKQMCKFHEAIMDLLPNAQVLGLFGRIHKNFKVYLRGQLIKLGVTCDGGPQHGLVMSDVAYYMGEIKSLANLEKLKEDMDDIWDKT